MRINENGMAWRSWDPESVRNQQGGINHGASAVQNLRAMGEDVMHAAIPLDRAISLGAALGSVLGALGAFIGFILGLFADIAELAMLPFMLLKNLVDILLHGGAAAVNAIQGESDGSVHPEDEPPFEFLDAPSAWRQLGQIGRRGIELDEPIRTGVSIRGS